MVIGVLTAPRNKPTLHRMLQGLKFTYNIPDVHVFAEPLVDVPEHEGQTVHQHAIKYGCFKNFDYAHQWLLDNTDSELILVLPDDVKFKSEWYNQACKVLEGIKDDNFGYLALYTPKGMGFAFPNNPKHEVIILNRGWGTGGWGGAYVFTRASLVHIMTSKFYQDHKKNYTKNQQFDECIKESCMEKGLNQYYMNPSLFDHVGETSTIGHTFRDLDKGLNFGRGV